ncbi:permease prefix domain 1-containing protein [Pontiellaceae bacterium B1224]|nr:permease prefix domain 1-containing protein [Pontiellaceae bacterium B1224]
MFDLANAITNWKSQLNINHTLKNEDIAELESHLVDEIDALQIKGLSSEESFLIATKRLGTNEVLAEEFGKNNLPSLWVHRITWMFLGTLMWGMATGLFGFIHRGTLIALQHTSLSKAWIISICSVAMIAFVAGIGFLVRGIIHGSALNQRISSLKRWGIFALLLIIPQLIGVTNGIMIRPLQKVIINDPSILSAFSFTTFIHSAISLIIKIAMIYFVAWHFSKNRKTIAV